MILSNKIAYFASPLDNCGTSYRVNSSLKLVPIKLEFNFTLQQREYQFLKITGEGYIPTYTRTLLTDKLHDVFGFRTDYEINSTDKMRGIIKNTKK